MKASQYVYTACGFNKNCGFDMWSKSADITKAECDEIIKVMAYRRPVDSPYEPTPQELETAFPKRYAFFALSSGRYCIAKSTYVCNMYIENDNRIGNYVVHALVFDNADSIYPMAFAGSDKFRKSLSAEEASKPAPENLPQLELNDYIAPVSMIELKKFVESKGADRFAEVLQSVIDVADTKDKFVVLCDNDENLWKWYKSLCICIPGNMQKNLPFSSYFAKSATEISLGTVPPVTLKIRNYYKSDSSLNSSFELNGGTAVFDYDKNVFGNGKKPSRYAKKAVSLFTADVALALKKRGEIDDIMSRYGLSLDEAFLVSSIIDGDLSVFVSGQELASCLTLCAQKGINDFKIVASLKNNVVAKNMYAGDPALLAVYKYVYDNGNEQDKKNVVNYFMKNAALFIKDNSDAKAYVADFKAKAPFPQTEYVEYLTNSGQLNSELALCSKSFSRAYLLFDSLAAYSVAKRTQTYIPALTDIIGASLSKGSLSEFSLLSSNLTDHGFNAVGAMVKNIVDSIKKSRKELLSVWGTDVALGVISKLSDTSLKKYIFDILLNESGLSESFVAKYVNAEAADPSTFGALEKSLPDTGLYHDFFMKKESFSFANKKNVSKSDLDRYYKIFYAEGFDAGSFAIQLKAYLIAIQDSNKRIDACLKVYDEYFDRLPSDFCDCVKISAMLADLIASTPHDAFAAYVVSTKNNVFERIIIRLRENRISVSDKFTAATIFHTLKTGALSGKADDSFLTALSERKVFSALTSPETAEMFNKHFLPELVRFCAVLLEKNSYSQKFFEDCFIELARQNGFPSCFVKAADSVKDGNSSKAFFTAWFVYSCTASTKFADYMKSRLSSYLEKMKSRDRKELFDDVLRLSPESAKKKVEEFIAEFKKAHDSFFGKLFEKLFGKKDKNNDRQNKNGNGDNDGDQIPPANRTGKNPMYGQKKTAGKMPFDPTNSKR